MSASVQGTSVPSVFQFESHKVRIFGDDQGQSWFCAKDVCAVLDYVNDRDAIKKHCRTKGVAKRYTPTEGGQQALTFINEGNLYRLITKSHLPAAERFEAWVFDEVLPTIRKTGRYEATSSELRKTQLKSAFREARWLAQYRDGEIHFEPLPSNAFVITPEEYISVLRTPHIFPSVCLPEVLAACAERIESLCERRRAAA